MAKKRKSRSTSGVGHSAIRRIAEPVNPFERQRNRYTPKCLTLAIMGGAAFFLLKGCGDGGNTDNDGDCGEAIISALIGDAEKLPQT